MVAWMRCYVHCAWLCGEKKYCSGIRQTAEANIILEIQNLEELSDTTASLARVSNTKRRQTYVVGRRSLRANMQSGPVLATPVGPAGRDGAYDEAKERCA